MDLVGFRKKLYSTSPFFLPLESAIRLSDCVQYNTYVNYYKRQCIKSSFFLRLGCTGLQVEELYSLDESSFESLRFVIYLPWQ